MPADTADCRVSWWSSLAFALLAPLLVGSGQANETGASRPAVTSSREVFRICHNQTYALCAVASCFVFNGVAYCTCDVEKGDSISLPFNYGNGRDVCSVNAEGVGNGYMVSTFSLAAAVVAPRGDMAIYTCPGATSSGAYAQCDGGICFRSTQGQDFPGSTRPLEPNQLICSCPITVADPPAAVGYQIAGPYPCRRSFFENCSRKVANTRTGSTIYVGAPTGTARLLTRLLYGSVPPLNRCPSPASATLP
jgi:hypothetical protein